VARVVLLTLLVLVVSRVVLALIATLSPFLACRCLLPIDSVCAMCEHVWTRAHVPRRDALSVVVSAASVSFCCCSAVARAVGLAPTVVCFAQPLCVVLSGGSPAVWRGGISNYGQVQVCCKYWFLTPGYVSGAGPCNFYASFIEIP
jgi:hypothetical protein